MPKKRQPLGGPRQKLRLQLQDQGKLTPAQIKKQLDDTFGPEPKPKKKK